MAPSPIWGLVLGGLVSFPMAISAYSTEEMMRVQQALMAGRPSDCPPCFNCLLPVHSCTQYAVCNESNGICDCPDGFGGDNCLEPLCGSLPRGRDRPMRQGSTCDCDEGWTGINCNVCDSNDACKPFVGDDEVGVCYDVGVAINQNFQMCDVTNEKITSLLGDQKPQVTISCKKEDQTCDFQFWVDHRESFYCHLNECESNFELGETKNSTSYNCKGIQCNCIADRMLCGENGSVDIADFLTQEIKGPGKIECVLEAGKERRCAFREPAMDNLITDLIGDSSILLACRSGECVHYTQVPGYHPPVHRINTPLIASVIAGVSLLLVALILILWYVSRRAFKRGPIYLEDSDDEQTRLMVDHQPSSLYFQDVCYHLIDKRILNSISGVAHPGEVTAVMGASGAGKTTFLDILARKNKRGIVSGDFYVNGRKVADADFKNAVGFVDQEDTLLPTLTVHETILNSALLRLPRDMSRTAKERRVYEVEKELGIYHIRDSLIGSSEGKGRGISGGEKRRVGIACELVTSPSILFLDEPTSGLDAFNAYNVIEALVTLAKNYKRTVIFTIHQPRSNIVALFDRLILLAQGKMVYSGPFTQCQSFFSHIGYSCPTGFNIADYMVDLTMHASSSNILDDGSISADAASVGVSSTAAIKSVASISGTSVGDESNVEASSRPRASRSDSVRKRQERELFSKRKNTADTTASSDAGGEDFGNYRLQRNPGSSSVPLLDASHDLPPTVGVDTELDALVQSFSQSVIASNAHEETYDAVTAALNANGQNVNGVEDSSQGMGKGYARVGYLRQFVILSRRTWKNLYRNPMLMLAHYAIAISLAVLLGYLFYGLSNELAGFQNRLGLFFFLLALFGFSTLSILNVFSSERLLFLRERANGYYSPFTYFAAKVLFDIIPLRVVPPILMGLIIYPMTGLIPDYAHFFKFLLVVVLFNLVAATICLFIGIVCKDPGLANLLGSLVMLASLLFSGPLLNAEAIPKAAVWLKSLSIFHYGFESLIVNEVVQLTLIDRKYGLDITVPGAAILSSFGFNNDAFWDDVAWLGVFAAFFMVLSYVSLHFLLVEKR